MTFGNNTLNQSRNMSVQKHTDLERESLKRANTQLESLQGNLNTIQTKISSPVRPFDEAPENPKSTEKPKEQPSVKRDYLRKGSKTRNAYDAQKSIEKEKERKKQRQGKD